jgi:hypothetical protein
VAGALQGFTRRATCSPATAGIAWWRVVLASVISTWLRRPPFLQLLFLKKYRPEIKFPR